MHVPVLFLPILFAGIAASGLGAQETATPSGAADPSQGGSRIVTGDRTIEAGQTVDEIVVVGGDLRVRGQVTGDAVVVDGDLILEETGLILGDALVTGGTLLNEGGRVRGEMRSVQGPGLNLSREAAESGGSTVVEVEESRAAARETTRTRVSRGIFDPIRHGIAGIIATLALGLVLAGVGSALVFYARPYLETVSDTIRGATLRSGATGLAASFLAVPAFVVLIVTLAVSIIGIPFLLLAVPLYPVALFAAGVFGLLAAAHAIGERTAEQSRDALDLRYRNSYAYLLTGLGMLLLPHLAAHLISMTGFLGFIGTLLRVLTWVAIWVAATVGFGAVILSRAGRRRTFVPAAPDVGTYEGDDFFADDSLGGPGNV
jgi:hypothetical protein